MATEIVLIKNGNTSVEEINSAYIRLKNLRVDTIYPKDHNTVTFNCYTNTGTDGLLDEIKPIEFNSLEGVNPESPWNKILLMNRGVGGFLDRANQNIKILIMDTKLFPRNTSQNTILDFINAKGKTTEVYEILDPETIATIKEQELPYMVMPTKWWTDEDTTTQTDYAHFFTAFNYRDLHEIYETFKADPTGLISKYGDTKQGVQKFIEDTFKGVVLPTGCGEFGIYYINDEEKNKRLIQEWEENVKCYFPQEWSIPNEEDIDADYISYDHEWRDISEQSRFIYAETQDEDTNNDTRADLYFRTWIHKE